MLQFINLFRRAAESSEAHQGGHLRALLILPTATIIRRGGVALPPSLARFPPSLPARLLIPPLHLPGRQYRAFHIYTNFSLQILYTDIDIAHTLRRPPGVALALQHRQPLPYVLQIGARKLGGQALVALVYPNKLISKRIPYTNRHTQK